MQGKLSGQVLLATLSVVRLASPCPRPHCSGMLPPISLLLKFKAVKFGNAPGSPQSIGRDPCMPLHKWSSRVLQPCVSQEHAPTLMRFWARDRLARGAVQFCHAAGRLAAQHPVSAESAVQLEQT